MFCSLCHKYEVHNKWLGAFNATVPDANLGQKKLDEEINFGTYLCVEWPFI